MINTDNNMSLVMRKPVFGVCDQLRLKPACSTDDTSWGLEISAIASREIILSKQRTTNVLIRMANEKADLCLCCLHMAKTGFLMMWLIYIWMTGKAGKNLTGMLWNVKFVIWFQKKSELHCSQLSSPKFYIKCCIERRYRWCQTIFFARLYEVQGELL